MKHKCPVASCTAQVEPHLLACSKHWFMLPYDIRVKVLKAWRNYGKDPGAYLAARGEAEDWWDLNVKP